MKETLDSYFDSLKGKKIAVLGIGVSNQPLIRLLLAHGLHVTACDKTPREQLDPAVLELEQAGAVLHTGADYLDHLTADVVFRTPGMHPENPALVKLREQGSVITSEMEAFFSVCPCEIFAVTGSDGKTTTTTLIAEILRQAGRTVWVGGNIGQPLLDRIPEMTASDLAVVELSSFQLMDMTHSPKVAVVTNLAPNHLDVHKDMEEYIAAKRNIFAYQDTGDKLVLNADNEITAGFASQARGEVTLFSRKKSLERGVCVRDGMICYHTRPILAADDILIPGVHNLENYMAAIAAVDGLVSDETIREYAKSFGGVAHRIELVRQLDGVRYYNDSIASSPTRTIAGLRSFSEKVILIAGGYDKHIPYDVLGPEIVKSVKCLILTGATSDKIQQATQQAPDYTPGNPEIRRCENLEQAVHTAHDVAQPGDVVILSPASASFDCFRNFEERGNKFKQYVNALEGVTAH